MTNSAFFKGLSTGMTNGYDYGLIASEEKAYAFNNFSTSRPRSRIMFVS